jgi:tetratricopeptide (TPR) repeat protein
MPALTIRTLLIVGLCAFEHSLDAAASSNVKQLELQAKQAFSREDYDAAVRLITEALQIEPNSISLHYARGVAYGRKGENDSAIRDYTEVIRLKPAVGIAYVDRGACYVNKGEYQRALSDYNQAIRLNSRDARAYCDRADLEDHVLHQADKALADYTQAIRLAPKFQRAYFNRGQHFHGRHEYTRALADFNQAVRLMPNDVDAYAARAKVYARLGDRAHAITDANKAIKLGPTTKMYLQRAVDFEMRAVAYKIVGQPALALRDLREAVRLAPRDSIANGSLAWFLATCSDEHVRNGSEAVVYAEKACELSRWDESGFIETLAAAYAEAGDFDRAIKYQRQSLSDPTLIPKNREEREKHLNLYQQRKPFREYEFEEDEPR